ncbi:acetoin utilization protein AcuC [Gottfriedia solisilvae]|uniref:Acetoin utilization protein AcuC n=1 Tax=Gottfriedia solisilvae TaxID=1516104 RepID=A0A8J3ABL7_9BACI|nr:acetoin utilization protein AcuC [Gottfriedia solisilvae]GGI10123.1 acetoin utilization protein AcuC [Gottfriedia solisilvae]
MKKDAYLIYSEDYHSYQFNENHPFNPIRSQLVYELLKESQLINDTDVLFPRVATDEELLLFHDSHYIEQVKKASQETINEQIAEQFGLGTEDTPIFKNMHEASSLIVGGTLTAVDAVLEGKANHAFNLGGGLHHGFKRKASGFCVYNDCAIAIKYIQKKYGLKVLYVDTDAHHGDGVQWAFYDDPTVCTLSIHETGRYLFPGTGGVNERGQGKGFGFSFNVPIDAFTEDDSFLVNYKKALSEIAEYFKPDIIFTQNGSDSHCYDPLTHLCTTMKTFQEIPKIAHEIAHKYCEGRWIAVAGGGYDYWRVVPRAWANVWLAMTNQQPSSEQIPKSWLEKWQKESNVTLPKTWTDDPSIVRNIPRKKEIEEYNSQILNRALDPLYIQQKKPFI